MSSVDPVVRLLADLDRPARPAAEFQDALLTRLLAEIEGAIRPEPETPATRHSNGWQARVPRAVTRRPGRTMLVAVAVAVAAAAALFVSSPWKTAPGFLEEVQAKATVQAAVTPLEVDGATADYLVVTWTRYIPAEGVTFAMEASTDAANWDGLVPHLGDSNQGDGTASVAYRSPSPVGTAEKLFVRARVSYGGS